MQFTVLINQSRALEWGLNAQQAMLFAFLHGCPAWADSTIVDGELFFRLSKTKVCQELPLLTDKPNTVHKLLKALEENGLIVMAVFSNETHISITEKGALWNSTEGVEKNPTFGKKSTPGMEKNPRRYGKKSTPGVEKNPTNQSISNQITKSDNHDHKNKYPDWFVDLLERYPPRSGSNDKRKAYHAVKARLAEGKTLDEIIRAVDRYKFFVISNNRINTEYTLMAATFFGPGGHIDNSWSVSDAPNQQRPGFSAGQPKTCFADESRAQARQLIEQIDDEIRGAPVYATG